MKFDWFGEPHISLGFAEINYERIACLIRETDPPGIVSFYAQTVAPEALAVLENKDSSLLIERNGYFYDVKAHRKSSDADLLETLLLFPKLEPEELEITVSEESESYGYYWDMTIIYHENAVDIYFDSSLRKRTAAKSFKQCFR